MEILVKILNFLGFSGVNVDSNPLVLYMFCINYISYIGFLSLLLSFIIIILGYNQKILNYLGKWVTSK